MILSTPLIIPFLPILPLHAFIDNTFFLSIIIFSILTSLFLFITNFAIHFFSPIFLFKKRKLILQHSFRKFSHQKQNIHLKKSGLLSRKKIYNLLRTRFLIRKKITEQIPPLIQSIGNSMQAGYSFFQSIQLLTPELPQPIKLYISELEKRILLGESVTDSLLNLKKRLNHQDLNFVVDSTIIQLKSGGNICKIYNKLSKSIQERIKLERDLQTAVSQGKLSGYIIAAMWPLSLLLFTILSPDYISILFSSSLGKFLIFLAITLEIIGFLCIHKITKLAL